MAPAYSRAAFRLVVSILLFTNIANAATLPHYALDPRSPLPQDAEVPPRTLDTAVPEPNENFFEEISDNLHKLSAWDLVRDFWDRLLGRKPSLPAPTRPGEDDDDSDDDDDADKTVTTTVYITPTLIEQSSPATLEVLSETSVSTSIEPWVTPPGPELSASVEPTPSPNDVFSILPVGPLTTAINATLPDPELASLTSTLEPSPSSPLESTVESQPPGNATTASEPTLTPAIITEIFSAALPSVSLEPSPSGNESSPTTDQSIPTDLVQPTISSSSNETVNATSTTLIIVTATVVPLPVEETGAGVLTPISDTVTLLWPNTTFVIPTAEISGTVVVSPAIGISNATASAIETPLYPNTTFVVPTLITVTGGPGSALNVSIPVTIPPFANTTYVLPTPISGTGSPASAANASAVVSEIIIPTAIPGTGSPGPTAGTIGNAPIPFTEIPYFPNVTIVEPTPIPGTGTAAPAAETEPALAPNVTTIFSTTTTTLAVSATSSVTPTSNDTEPLDSSVEFPGLFAFRHLCQDLQIRVITLPLLNRFYGPSGYPSLLAFPGCVAPNDRQAAQAPGLLNCTALGREVQSCQASGRKVFLSVKGDDLGVVGGNARFGDPDSPAQPFGPYFIDANADDDEKRKRQIGRWGGSRPVPVVVAPPPPVPEDQRDAIVVVAQPTITPETKPSVIAEDPIVMATPVVLESSILVPTPVVVETPVIVESPVLVPTPVVVETPVIVASPVIVESPVVVESPVFSEPSEIPELAPVSESPDVPEPTIIAEPPVIAEPSVVEDPSVILEPTIIEAPSVITEPSAAPEPSIFIDPIFTEPIPIIAPYPAPAEQPAPAFPNLFDINHPPSALALTLFSLFGEGHTERLDLRPLGPDAAAETAPNAIISNDAIEVGQALARLARPLGEEVVVDGYDVQLPAQWKGSYQEGKFKELVGRLRQLNREAWKASGGIEGGPGDLGADGRPEVYFGWVGELVKAREAKVAQGARAGWVEWDGQ